MATLAALRVNVLANTAKLEAGMKRAERSVKRMGDAATRAGTALAKGLTVPITLAAGGLFLLAKTSADVGDRLSKMSERTGLSTETLSKWKRSVELGGSSLDAFGKGVKRLNANMFDLTHGAGEEAKRAFEDLGISVVDSRGQLKSTEGVMFEIADAFTKMEDGAQKNALSQKLLGRAGEELINTFNMGTPAILKQMEATTKLGGVYDTAGTKNAAAFNDSLTDLGIAFTGLKWKIAKSLFPVLTALSDRLTKFVTTSGTIKRMISGIENLVKAFGNLPIKVQLTIIAVAGLLAVLGPLLIIIGFLGPAIAGVLVGAFTILLGPVGLAIAAVLAFGTAGILIWRNWDKIRKFFIGPVVNAFKKVGMFFVALGKSIASVMLVPFRLILEGVEYVLAGIARAASFIPGVGDDISRGLNRAKESVTGLQGKIDDLRQDSFAKLSDAAGDLVNGSVYIKDAFVDTAINGVQFMRNEMGKYTKLVSNLTTPAVNDLVETTKTFNMAQEKANKLLTQAELLEKLLQKAKDKGLTTSEGVTVELLKFSKAMKGNIAVANKFGNALTGSIGDALTAIGGEIDHVGDFIKNKFTDLFGESGAGGVVGRILGTFFGSFSKRLIQQFVSNWTSKFVGLLTSSVPALKGLLSGFSNQAASTAVSMQALPATAIKTATEFTKLGTTKDKLINNLGVLVDANQAATSSMGNLTSQTAGATAGLGAFITKAISAAASINIIKTAEVGLIAALNQRKAISLPTPLATTPTIANQPLTENLIAAAVETAETSSPLPIIAGVAAAVAAIGAALWGFFGSPQSNPFEGMLEYAHGGPIGFDQPSLAMLHPSDSFMLTNRGPNSIRELASLVGAQSGTQVTNHIQIDVHGTDGKLDVGQLSRDLAFEIEQRMPGRMT